MSKRYDTAYLISWVEACIEDQATELPDVMDHFRYLFTFQSEEDLISAVHCPKLSKYRKDRVDKVRLLFNFEELSVELVFPEE